jgi:hypothetical protein
MDVNTVTAAVKGLKYSYDVLSAIKGGEVKLENQAQVLEALQQMHNTLDTLYELREELFRLQAENYDLNTKLAEVNDWKIRLAAMKLVTTPGGAQVYESHEGGERHIICPACVNKEEVQVLQFNSSLFGTSHCPGCKAEFNTAVPTDR